MEGDHWHYGTPDPEMH